MRSALFVDFDNVFISLQNSSRQSARRFAETPGSWLQWFLDGGHDSSEQPEPRRILLSRCYLNPEKFGTYRKYFTYNGFQTIDCPSLTGMGKNSADIYMVLDIIETLSHNTLFEEFIILSADADFTPVLLKLREHDRRTAILSTAVTSSALRNSATHSFELDDFIEEALVYEYLDDDTDVVGSNYGDTISRLTNSEEELGFVARSLFDRLNDSGPILKSKAPAAILPDYPPLRGSRWLGFGTLNSLVEVLVDQDAGLALELRDGEEWLCASVVEKPTGTEFSAKKNEGDESEAVIAYIEKELSESVKPLRGSALGLKITQRFGSRIQNTDWFGSGTLSKFIQESRREGIATTSRAGGLIFDPRRHDPKDIATVSPGENLRGLPDQMLQFINRLSTVGWPQLSPSQIDRIAIETARLIQRGVTERNPLSAQVRDSITAAVSAGEIKETESVSRNSINFLLTGILNQGAIFGVTCVIEADVRNLLESTLQALVANRLGPPSETDLEMICSLVGTTDSQRTRHRPPLSAE